MNFLNLKAPELSTRQGLLLLCHERRTYLCGMGRITLCYFDLGGVSSHYNVNIVNNNNKKQTCEAKCQNERVKRSPTVGSLNF